MLVCDLGRGYLPWKLRAGHKLGTWAGPLLELLLSLRPLGTAEAQRSIWLLQKHLEAQQKCHKAVITALTGPHVYGPLYGLPIPGIMAAFLFRLTCLGRFTH